MIKLFRFLNTLSLDTALGAVAISYLIGIAGNGVSGWATYSALFISVVAIYNFDHLIDALMLNQEGDTFRHAFYQRHFIPLVYWQLLLVIIGAFIVFKLPYVIVLAGVGMLAVIGLYFWLILRALQNNLVYREVLVALGYTLAVVLPSLFSNPTLSLHFIWVILLVFLIALTNLWVFSIYDLPIDLKEKRHSIARSLQDTKLIFLTRLLILSTLLLIIGYGTFVSDWVLAAILILIEVVYWWLLEKKSWFIKGELYRLIGEAILILPGITFFIDSVL